VTERWNCRHGLKRRGKRKGLFSRKLAAGSMQRPFIARACRASCTRRLKRNRGDWPRTRLSGIFDQLAAASPVSAAMIENLGATRSRHTRAYTSNTSSKLSGKLWRATRSLICRSAV
jgi:hypothetical protein